MATKSSTVNEIVVSGRAITTKETKNSEATITIVSKCGNNSSYIHFRCNKDIIPSYKHRAHVTVRGHVRSLRFKDGDRKRTGQVFVADEINTSRTLTDEKFGIKGRFFDDPQSKAYIKGVVKRIVDDGDWLRVSVEVDRDINNRNASTVLMSMKKLDRQPKINIGDVLCVVAGIVTHKKTVEGKNIYFEDLVVQDFAIA